jgi:predicted transcriptional regulator
MRLEESPGKIARDLSNKPHRILISIQTRGGCVPKARITEDTGFESNLINHHLQNLMDAELVRRVGDTSPDEVTREGYTYQITEKGEDVLTAAQEDYNLTPIEQSEVRRRLEQLEARTENLEKQNQKLVEEVEEHTEENERLEGRIDDMRDANSQLWEDVQKLK